MTGGRKKWRSAPELGVPASLLLGVVCAAASLLLRASLTRFMGGEERFVALFPALLVASYYGGLVGGVSCLVTALVSAWYVFLGPPASFVLAPQEGAGLAALLVSGVWVVAGVEVLRRLVRRLREAGDAERMLARELQHRVKNNLAVVEALAMQSARGGGDLHVFLDRFLGRMRSLSAAQVLISREDHPGAKLDELVGAVLAPFEAPRRITWSGAPIELDAQQAVALALCLHELATNALKYGALRTEDGGVRIGWSRLDSRFVAIRWEETGGPVVSEPERAGSGLALLRHGLEPSLPAELAYRPEGVVWTARFRSPG